MSRVGLLCHIIIRFLIFQGIFVLFSVAATPLVLQTVYGVSISLHLTALVIPTFFLIVALTNLSNSISLWLNNAVLLLYSAMCNQHMVVLIKLTGFPGGSVVKDLPVNAGDTRVAGWIHGLGRSPAAGNGSLRVPWRIPMDRGASGLQSMGVPSGDGLSTQSILNSSCLLSAH